MSRPRLLDLFCGAGGASMGYARAGFEVVGVDVRPMPRYPFEFHQVDAMTFPLDGFDAVHANPPCQRYSMITRNFGTADQHPDLLAATRDLLSDWGFPWVIENVPGAPMRPDIKLCGCMFGLRGLRRERWFETSWRAFAMVPGHDHTVPAITITGHGMTAWSRAKWGRELTPDEKRAAMGIGWMTTWELAEAIPPAYTEFVGGYLLAEVERRGAA